MAMEELPCPYCNNLDKAMVHGSVVNTFEETGGGLVGSTVKFVKSNSHMETTCVNCNQRYTIEYK